MFVAGALMVTGLASGLAKARHKGIPEGIVSGILESQTQGSDYGGLHTGGTCAAYLVSINLAYLTSPC